MIRLGISRFLGHGRLVALGALALFLSVAGRVLAEDRFVTLGTWGGMGFYYPAGGAICQMVNQERSRHGLRCVVEGTSGSLYNLQGVREGDLDLAIVQSDWHYHAANGSSQFADDGPDTSLRSLFALHPQPLTVLVRADSDIQKLADLEGKRVNIGNFGSGQRGMMEVLMSALGWTQSDFSKVLELNAMEQAQALCDNEVDAVVYTVGHPNGLLLETTSRCEGRLIEVSGPVVEKLIADHAYYRRAIIPGRLYPENSEDLLSFGVGATVVASQQVPEEVAYEIVKAVFANLDDFRNRHPAFSRLAPEQMSRDSLSAPLHPGAERYFKEAGLR